MEAHISITEWPWELLLAIEESIGFSSLVEVLHVVELFEHVLKDLWLLIAS